MEDLEVAASDAANEADSIEPARATTTPEIAESPEALPVAKSSSEAIDRALSQLDPKTRPARKARKPDGRVARDKSSVETMNEKAVGADPAIQTAPEIGSGRTPAVRVPNLGLSREAQAAWEQAPEPVRKDIERRVGELTRGIENYRQEFESLKPYAQMAQQAGKPLDRVLKDFVDAENLIRQNPAQGFASLCAALGRHPADVAQEMIQLSRGAPARGLPQQPQLDQTQLLQALDRKVEEKLNERDAIAQIDEFRRVHPRFEELAESISKLLETGLAADLPDAYAKAELLTPAQTAALAAATSPAAPQTPATRKAVQTAQPDAKVQAKAKLSVTGAPRSGSNPATRKVPATTRDAVEKAFAQLGL
jgi:hypothetical protein